jgi:zinc/manganese transport system substrate-binding protein
VTTILKKLVRGAAPLLVTIAVVGVHGSDVAGAKAPAAGSSPVKVVAAENFWGSIVKQLAGKRASVSSIITNPNTDPHDYEAKPSDGRAIASAKYVIVNGIGYDAWATKLLDANPDNSRKVLNVGDLVGVSQGGNPHQWYSPETVSRFIDRVNADLSSVDPKNATYYDQQKAKLQSMALARYNGLIGDIKQKYAATPIGASESIVAPLAEALGLMVATPETFLDSISEGTDPTAQDKATVDRQIKSKEIKVFVYNSQNATPDVKALVKDAKAHGIPVATVTETLVPASATFQAWQVKELQGIENALAKATGT